MNYARIGTGDLTAIKDAATIVTPDKDGYLTLANSTTYYIEIGSSESPTVAETVDFSLHLKWIAALAATATLEWTNFPETKGGMPGTGAADVSSFDATAGNWIQDGLTVGVNTTVTGTGNSFTAPTLTFGGTNAGSFGIQLADRSARRYRLKLVVTTGGTAALRASAHGKLGA
jgi:hypothetical protein